MTHNRFYSGGEKGFTLVELLATTVVMSILAVMVAPMGTIIFFQDKELMLKENLREIRRAIDKFYDTNTRKFNKDLTESPQHYYPFTWQDLYEGYLRKAHSLNPITHRFEDYDVFLDKNGIYWSEDYNAATGITQSLTDRTHIDGMSYPEVLSSIGDVSPNTVHLSPQEFKIRQYDSDDSAIAGFAEIKWLEAGMFDVRFPHKYLNSSDPDKVDPLYRNQTSIDGKSLYHQW